jgi:hypothetical protein
VHDDEVPSVTVLCMVTSAFATVWVVVRVMAVRVVYDTVAGVLDRLGGLSVAWLEGFTVHIGIRDVARDGPGRRLRVSVLSKGSSRGTLCQHQYNGRYRSGKGVL